MTEVILLKRKLFLVCFAGKKKKDKFQFGAIPVGRSRILALPNCWGGGGRQGHSTCSTSICGASVGQEGLEPEGCIPFWAAFLGLEGKK